MQGLEIALERRGLFRGAFETGLSHGGDLIDDHPLALGISGCLVPPSSEHGVQGAGCAGGEVIVNPLDAVTLPVLAGNVRGHVHHIKHGDGLEKTDFGVGFRRDDQVAVHATDGTVVGCLGGGDDGANVTPDELGGHLL